MLNHGQWRSVAVIVQKKKKLKKREKAEDMGSADWQTKTEI